METPEFIVEDLLEFPNYDAGVENGNFGDVSGSEPQLLGEGCRSFADFSIDICVPPAEVAAELEFLSNLLEEPFWSEEEDVQKFRLISGMAAPADGYPEIAVPRKARSKRSRAAPCNWTSCNWTSVRRCLHYATHETPQWRIGPMGTKTLCNACGLRYMSGRLVPEYRPAVSPTFVATKHSNSHKKVMELRRTQPPQTRCLPC
ncbi:hypothetical protein U1Q18_020540 [Sarracenia purpurea var. burkii]